MKGSKRRTWLLVGAACIVIVLLCAVWGYQRAKKARELVESTAEPVIAQSAEEAFDAAVRFHHTSHPELGGYNILDQRTTPEGGRYNVRFTCGGWKFAYEVDGQDGSVRAGETDYVPSAAPAPENPEPAAQPDTPADEPPAPGAAQAGSGIIDEQAALEAALAHAGVNEADLVYQFVELEYDDGKPVYYEVEFGAGDTAYGYEIGLDDGAVLAWEYEKNRVLDAHHPELFHHHHTQAADIGADAALDAALTHAGLTEDEAWMQRVEPDWDDGYLVYEVKFRAGKVEYEYKVDAANGEILEFEQETF